MSNDPEFYCGYLPIPPGIKAQMRRTVAALAVVVAVAAVILVAAQHPFAGATFEFQQYRDFHGLAVKDPYPALIVPGESSSWLLVGPGKHRVEGLDRYIGRGVQLKGERIVRGGDHMIEVLPGSIGAQDTSITLPPYADLGPVQLTGEIVDSKCYFGVMNPGNGKVHRDCAARCISGGVPPAFLVRDAAGTLETILLANWNPAWLAHVAEPVTLRGRLSRSSGKLILNAE